jgi:hypothetical protein
MNRGVEDTAALHEGTAMTKRTLLFGQEAVQTDSVVVISLKHAVPSA